MLAWRLTSRQTRPVCGRSGATGCGSSTQPPSVMANLGPQQFEIPVSDQLFQTMNPADPIIGIAPDVHVPVTIPWNANRTDLAKDKDNNDKPVVFGKAKWAGAGPEPHDIYEEQIGGQRVKGGTVTWSVDTEVFQDWL